MQGLNGLNQVTPPVTPEVNIVIEEKKVKSGTIINQEGISQSVVSNPKNLPNVPIIQGLGNPTIKNVGEQLKTLSDFEIHVEEEVPNLDMAEQINQLGGQSLGIQNQNPTSSQVRNTNSLTGFKEEGDDSIEDPGNDQAPVTPPTSPRGEQVEGDEELDDPLSSGQGHDELEIEQQPPTISTVLTPQPQQPIQGSPPPPQPPPPAQPEQLTFGLDDFASANAANNMQKNIKTDPHKILRSGFDLLNQKLNSEGKPLAATLKITSNLDEELRKTGNQPPEFEVEAFVDNKGKQIYKVKVAFTAVAMDANGLPIKDDQGRDVTLTLHREFYTNAPDKKAALVAVYETTRSIKDSFNQNRPDNNEGTYHVHLIRNPSGDVTGVSQVRSGNVDVTYRRDANKAHKYVYEKTVSGHTRKIKQENVTDDPKGLRGVQQYKSKYERLLRADFKEVNALSIADRLKERKLNASDYIGKQAHIMKEIKDQFEIEKKALKQDAFISWMNKKEPSVFKRFATFIKGNKEEQKILKENSPAMANYLILQDKLAQNPSDQTLQQAVDQARVKAYDERKAAFAHLNKLQEMQEDLLKARAELVEMKQAILANLPQGKQNQDYDVYTIDETLQQYDKDIDSNQKFLDGTVNRLKQVLGPPPPPPAPPPPPTTPVTVSTAPNNSV